MNIDQLCTQQQFAFFCNSPFVRSFLSNGRQFNQNPLLRPLLPPNNSLNPTKPPVDQGIKFPQVPDRENHFGPSTWQNKPGLPHNNPSDKPQLPDNEHLYGPPSSESKPGPPIKIPELPSNENPIPEPGNSNEPTPEGEDTCNKSALSSLIGSTYSPKAKEFSKKDGTSLKYKSLPKGYRVIGPMTMVTMDYQSQRANIHYKPKDGGGNNRDELADGIVYKITCG